MKSTTTFDNCKPIGYLPSCLISFALVIWLCAAGSAGATDYGAEFNPTGNPIGGGAGYSNIVARESADYIVTNKAELLSALNVARSGAVIYIDDDVEIDLTGTTNTKIWPGVTIASGRGRNGSEGALLYETGYGISGYYFWVGSGGTTPARITGLRFFGADMEIGDQEGPYLYGSAVHLIGSANLEVDNCELAGWGSAAIELAIPTVDGGITYAYVHHNYIHHNRRNGLGYGVCLGPSTAARRITALIEANLFDYGRHFIAGNGPPGNSYVARYNLCLEHDFSHSFDMHGGTDRGDSTTVAGDSVTIYCNTFRDPDQRGICIRGKPVYMSPIYNNWFYHTSAEVEPSPVEQLYDTGNLDIHDNLYGVTPPGTALLPVSTPRADRASGTAPLTVSFDGSASSALSGTLAEYEWFIGDSSTTIGSTAKGVQVSHTFHDPGVYNVLLQVKDSRGVTTRNTVPVTVLSSSGSCVLSFWVKDSYRGAVTGLYQEEALIDGAVAWSRDIAGDDGWVHVVMDVSAWTAGKSQVTLMLRTRCLSDPSSAGVARMLFTYWDDVVLFGFETKNGDFESSVSADNWTFSETGSSSWDGRRYTGELRSGYASYRMYWPSTSNSVNCSAQISQTLVKTPDAAPTVVAATPSGNDVAAETMIAAAFSEEMDQGTVQNAFSISPAVSGSFSWSGNTLMFLPSAALRYSTLYTVTISTAAKDLAGEAMAEAYTWQFTVATPSITVRGLTDNSAVSGTVAVEAAIVDIAGVTVEFILDNILVATRTAPPFVWNWDTGAAAAGGHALRIVARTTDGIVSERSMTLHVLKTENEVVYPNPYIKGKSAGSHKVTIANLPAASTVRIYTMGGELVTTLPHGQTTDGGSEEWDITGVPAGIYFYSIAAEGRSARNGKIGIIK
jgi:PKD repeat protein